MSSVDRRCARLCSLQPLSGGGAVPPLSGSGNQGPDLHRRQPRLGLQLARLLRAMRIPCDISDWSRAGSPTPIPVRWRGRKNVFLSTRRWSENSASLGSRSTCGNTRTFTRLHLCTCLVAPHSGDYLVWGGLVVDFADPEAFRIFADYHDREFVSQGILGFKADECDNQPIDDPTPFNYPYSSVFASGIDGDQMTQLFGYYQQRALLSVFRAHNHRTWGDVRATTALASPLPFNLYSDAYTFEQYLRQLVNASFTGLLWSPEVREARNLDELLNRVAMSAFAPQMCLDLWFMPHPPWEQYDGAKNKAHQLLPEAERQEVANRLRSIVNQRYELLPYLYACFHRYRTEGLPPVRLLLLDFPQDRTLRAVDNAFLFGDSLLVAPFIGEAGSRTLVLPQGVRWYELKTSRWHDGGALVQITGKPGEMPLFVKENSLLPLAEPVEHVNRDTVFKITVKAFGKSPAPFTLIEDDGETYDFEKGAFNRVVLKWQANGGGKVERAGPFAGRRYDIVTWESQPGL